MGTAGAVRNCLDFLDARPFLVLSGDGVFDFDLRPLAEAQRRHGVLAAMALYPQAAPLSYGLALTDRRGFIRGFIEKPGWSRVVTDLVNTGIYALDPRALEAVPPDTPFDFARDLFPLLLARGEPLFGLPMEGYWKDIGDPLSYYQANLDALEGRIRPLPGEERTSRTPSAEPTEREDTRRYAYTASVDTARRARLMHALSSSLMEAGADFTDGLSLPAAPGGLHIRPESSAGRIRLESDSEATLRQYTDLARRLDKG